MNPIKYTVTNVVETLLRLFPFRARTGLVRIGDPDRKSPVLVTCNFHLTVERVKRSLRGINAYLLVANSRGVNVWCAAAGGLFTNHDVISALKTSGIEEFVDHRTVILPQFAAAGVEASVIREKTGWKPIWGPVYARDIPRFLQEDCRKTPEMRVVEFPVLQRVEMAAIWAFPVSLILALILIAFWRAAVLPATLFVWGLSLLLFVAFPAYGHLLSSEKNVFGFVPLKWGQGGFQLLVWGLILVGLFACGALVRDFGWGALIGWSLISLVVVVGVSVDVMGSTPTHKSGLHEDRLFSIALDEEKCTGDAVCEHVCPRDCYQMDTVRHKATMPRANLCVQCGACIVQCPADALCFQTPMGETIPPATIRKFKLNLLGHRATAEEDS